MARLAPAYQPRKPTETVLYRVVRETLETFLSHARETYSLPLPRYVEREFRGYLRCGVSALVPPPRYPLLRFHGVLGPRSSSQYALVQHELHMNEVDYSIWEAYKTTAPAYVVTHDGVPMVSVYKR